MDRGRREIIRQMEATLTTANYVEESDTGGDLCAVWSEVQKKTVFIEYWSVVRNTVQQYGEKYCSEGEPDEEDGRAGCQ